MEEIHVYGMKCMWHGSISKVGHLSENNISLPCCPFCKGMLLQIPETQWSKNLEEFNASHNNYAAFIKWLEEQPLCYKKLADAKSAFEIATGKLVNL